MLNEDKLIAFGPVPSRRLGKSMGINNIPPKFCTYSCIYCQLGRSLHMQIKRGEFYNLDEIFPVVKRKVEDAIDRNEPIDYLTFVSDGEPTLDINLGREIEQVKLLGFKVAVISNSSLIWREDVRDELSKANLVSLKIDAISQDIWRRINRPHRSLELDKILDGIIKFSKIFKGEMLTESMLIQDVNDSRDEIEKISDFIIKLNSKKSYISIPTRPPAEKWVKPASEHELNKAYQIFKEKGIDTEYLIGYEGNEIAFTGNFEQDFLSIVSVHPLREDGVNELLRKSGENWDLVEDLLTNKKILKVEYKNKRYYIRNFKKRKV